MTAAVMVARHSAMVLVDGTVHRVRRARTLADADARIVQEHPELWKPMQIDFPADTAPVTVHFSGTLLPSSKDVRAWAKAEGIDVPTRGKLPDEVIARYQAAHEQG